MMVHHWDVARAPRGRNRRAERVSFMVRAFWSSEEDICLERKRENRLLQDWRGRLTPAMALVLYYFHGVL
jgi:hypothetical protein